MFIRLLYIFLYANTIMAMIVLIPFITNDYVLSTLYAFFIFLLLRFKPEPYDRTALLIGLVGITIAEYIFVSTGVETFIRNSLFGIMPLWLPLLWAYAFVVIKRSMRLLVN
jgi:hypothetical protein